MTGLVEQLQVDALNPDIPVSTLLRKVKVAAVKLGLEDALSWVQSELNGYSGELPTYRVGAGKTVGFNPYHGWQPFYFQDAETSDMVATAHFAEPIANYEALLQNGSVSFTIDLPARLVSMLNENLRFTVPRIANQIGRGSIVQIVQHVRDMVLDWALELARAGVTGEGMSFTNDERERAVSAHISIGTFQGSFNTGDASGANARINQASSDGSQNTASQTSIFGDIERAVIAAVSDPAARDAILAANSAMSVAPDKVSLLAAYHRFIASAANHMTIVAPFLPALGNLLGGQ